MNTAANRLTHAVMIAAALAACFMVQQARAAQASPAPVAMTRAAGGVVTLPKVIVTGKRMQTQVVYLPRVVVSGKRLGTNDTMQARKDGQQAVLVAMR